MSAQDGTGRARSEPGNPARTLPSFPPSFLPSFLPLSARGAASVACQSAGMLMREPAGRGGVRCGKNLPSDAPNMVSQATGSRRGEKRGARRGQEKDSQYGGALEMMRPVGVKHQHAAGRGAASRCWEDLNVVGGPLFRSGLEQSSR